MKINGNQLFLVLLFLVLLLLFLVLLLLFLVFPCFAAFAFPCFAFARCLLLLLAATGR
jgi:hypothetical protein